MSELPQSGASPIQRSWERCLHQGLSRQQSAELDLLPQGELSARQEQHRTLIACFQRFVLPLFGQLLAGRPCRLLLCDGEGAILAVSGDDRFARHAERIFLRSGARWGRRARAPTPSAPRWPSRARCRCWGRSTSSPSTVFSVAAPAPAWA